MGLQVFNHLITLVWVVFLMLWLKETGTSWWQLNPVPDWADVFVGGNSILWLHPPVTTASTLALTDVTRTSFGFILWKGRGGVAAILVQVRRLAYKRFKSNSSHRCVVLRCARCVAVLSEELKLAKVWVCFLKKRGVGACSTNQTQSRQTWAPHYENRLLRWCWWCWWLRWWWRRRRCRSRCFFFYSESLWFQEEQGIMGDAVPDTALSEEWDFLLQVVSLPDREAVEVLHGHPEHAEELRLGEVPLPGRETFSHNRGAQRETEREREVRERERER